MSIRNTSPIFYLCCCVYLFGSVSFFSFIASPIQAQPTRNGKLFDQALAMTERSPRAHPALDQAKTMLGLWDVEITSFPTDTTSFRSTGVAEVTYMNRGYAYMTRMHVPAFDEAGHEANMIQFLAFSPVNEAWVMGEANSYTESISMYDGDFQNGRLILKTAVRHRGGASLTYYQLAYAFPSEDVFEQTTRISTDHGDTWRVVASATYRRRTQNQDYFTAKDDIGAPAPDRPEEAGQFDFLLGTWDSMHEINLGGRWTRFPVNATAVYALNGHAILEHTWYDVDPNLPDAATSIVRLYNRAMRRWESLYLENRSNTPLFFGGQQEGEDLVLHLFEARTTDPAIPRFVFHDIEKDSYNWHALRSTDRGERFDTTWVISVQRSGF